MNKNQIAVNIFNKYAQQYSERFMDVSLYHQTFDSFLSRLPIKEAEILEVACGPGNITKYLLSEQPALRIFGTDLAPQMLEIAKQHNPTATFELLDAREIKSLGKKFHGILCGFCFPYFSKEEALKFIHDASSVLLDNGVIYISTMEDDYSKSGPKKGSQGDEIFMHFHEAAYLTEELLKNGFTNIDTHRLESKGTDGLTYTDLVLIAKN